MPIRTAARGARGGVFHGLPSSAALYAYGRRGQVLVLDIPDDEAQLQVRKELWLNDKAERLIARERFDGRTLEDLSPNQDRILQRYFDAHERAFSDAEVSFQVAHALVCRCETGFLQCELCWTDVAREVGLDREQGSLARLLKSVPRQSFTLVQRMAEGKFGPNYVRCTTPINNVRITSFFAGEWSRTPF